MLTTAGKIMDDVRALLNDTRGTLYKNEVQWPHLIRAYEELEQVLQQHGISYMNATDTSVVIPAGTTSAGGPNEPQLPSDLIEIRELYERTNDVEQNWQIMQKCDFLPTNTVQTSFLIWYTWTKQQLKFVGATSDIQLRIDYIASALNPLQSEASVIRLSQADLFLKYRTAANCALFIGENSERAEALNQNATLALDRILGIKIKPQQAIPTRRLPFRLRWKRRAGM